MRRRAGIERELQVYFYRINKRVLRCVTDMWTRGLSGHVAIVIGGRVQGEPSVATCAMRCEVIFGCLQ